jgi:general nucleoside transport system permease protein
MPWDRILSTTFLVALMVAGIRLMVPIFLAALGEIITERAGVLNLGLEGLMLMGGFAGFTIAYAIQQLPGGDGMVPISHVAAVLLALIVGGLMGLILAFLCVTLRADQVISSVILVILGQGLTTYLYRQLFAGQLGPRVTGFPEISIPVLNELPIVGPIFFQQNLAVYLSGILLVVVWYALTRTTWGLSVRAVGQYPVAADTSGVNVTRVRYVATIVGAALAALGGAVLTVGQLQLFKENVTAGRGWIAVGLVVFSRRRPVLALLGALLFGLADALQFRIQALNIPELPYEFLLMLPYLLTILVLLRRKHGEAAPAALGIPYTPEER